LQRKEKGNNISLYEELIKRAEIMVEASSSEEEFLNAIFLSV